MRKREVHINGSASWKQGFQSLTLDARCQFDHGQIASPLQTSISSSLTQLLEYQPPDRCDDWWRYRTWMIGDRAGHVLNTHLIILLYIFFFKVKKLTFRWPPFAVWKCVKPGLSLVLPRKRMGISCSASGMNYHFQRSGWMCFFKATFFILLLFLLCVRHVKSSGNCVVFPFLVVVPGLENRRWAEAQVAEQKEGKELKEKG